MLSQNFITLQRILYKSSFRTLSTSNICLCDNKNNKDDSLKVILRDSIDGYSVSKELGIVSGSSVKSRGVLFDIYARIRGILGGELRSYGELLSSSSAEATRRMMREAEHLNGDGVIRIRYQVSSTADPGTAVKLQKEK